MCVHVCVTLRLLGKRSGSDRGRGASILVGIWSVVSVIFVVVIVSMLPEDSEGSDTD